MKTAFFAVLVLTICAIDEPICAQFSTVYNVPPDVAPSVLSFNTQLNLFDGGVIGDTVGGGESELNVFGGWVANNSVIRNVDLNIYDGVVGDNVTIVSIPSVLIAGGVIGSSFHSDFSSVTVTGGTFGDGFRSNAMPLLIGSDFRVDGVLVNGLENIGDEQSVFVNGEVLSGTFFDGTPFAFQSNIDLRRVRLRKSDLPLPIPFQAVSAAASAIFGVRDGETLLVDAALGKHFNAGRGSQVDVVDGGSIGENFEAVSAVVSITGGTIGEGFQAFGDSTVEISGGSIGARFEALGGSTVEISGGTIAEDFQARDGSSVAISGGTIENLNVIGVGNAEVSISGGRLGRIGANVFGGSGRANMSGGKVGLIEQQPGNELNISGGTVSEVAIVGPYSFARTRARINVSGGNVGFRTADIVNFIGRTFSIDGQPIAGLVPGVPFEINKEVGLFSGTLADGTTFAHELYSADAYPVPGRRFKTLTVTFVPEPSAIVLLVIGCLTTWMRMQRFRQSADDDVSSDLEEKTPPEWLVLKV